MLRTPGLAMWHRDLMSEASNRRSGETRDDSRPPLDPLVVAAAREVDRTLLDWALSLSPRERLRACSKAAITLSQFAHASSRTR